jgi:hypothetical protein
MTGAAGDLTADMGLMETMDPRGETNPLGAVRLMDVANGMKKAANRAGGAKTVGHNRKLGPGDEVVKNEAVSMNADIPTPAPAAPMKAIVIPTGATAMEPAGAVLLRWMRISSAK